MSLHPSDDEAVGWTEARWLVGDGKAKARFRPLFARPLCYEAPEDSCPLCGTPTSGVLCTPCATR